MWRSRRLLDHAREVPYCMSCFKCNDGTIVAAHSNQLRDGKGGALKAHDYRIAYLCVECHHSIDAGRKDYDEAIEVFEAAHRETIAYLFEHHIVRVV